MKMFKLVVLAIIAVSFAYCGKKGLEIQFNLPTQSLSFDVDTTSIVGSRQYIVTKTLSSLDSIAKANKTSIDKIKSIEPKSITISIVTPDTSTFNPMDTLIFTLSTPGKNNGVKVATFTNIPKGIDTYTFTPEKSDVFALFKEKEITLTTRLATNKPIYVKTRIKVQITPQATASIVK
jgi:hypothetical protein